MQKQDSPDLPKQKLFYVEISRDRDRAELVTDDAKALRKQLEAVTGERAAERGLEPDGRSEGKDLHSPVVERDRSEGMDLRL